MHRKFCETRGAQAAHDRCDDDPSVHEAPAEKAAAASEGAGDGEVGVVVKS